MVEVERSQRVGDAVIDEVLTSRLVSGNLGADLEGDGGLPENPSVIIVSKLGTVTLYTWEEVVWEMALKGWEVTF